MRQGTRFAASIVGRVKRSDTLSLYLVQVFGYIVPLIQMPALARVLGVSYFGEFVFLQAVAMFAALLVEYGFGLTAVRRLTSTEPSGEFVKRMLGVITVAKFVLTTPFVVIAGTVIYFFDTGKLTTLDSLAIFIGALAIAFSPLWCFQGIGRTRSFAFMDSSVRILALIVFLVLAVATVNPTLLIISVSSAAVVSTGLGYYRLISEYNWKWPSLREVIGEIVNGFDVFVFKGAWSGYSMGNPILLGFVAGSADVGIYAAIERLIKAVGGLMTPISQMMFPRVSAAFAVSDEAGRITFWTGARKMLSGGLALSLLTLAIGPFVFVFLFGDDFKIATSNIYIVSFMPLFYAITNTFGIQWMLNVYLDKYHRNIMVGLFLVNIPLGIALGLAYGYVGMLMTLVLAEMLAVLAISAVLVAKKKLPWKSIRERKLE